MFICTIYIYIHSYCTDRDRRESVVGKFQSWHSIWFPKHCVRSEFLSAKLGVFTEHSQSSPHPIPIKNIS